MAASLSRRATEQFARLWLVINQRLSSDRQIFSTKYCQEERRAGMLAKAGDVTVGEQLGAKKDDQDQVEQPPL